MCATNGRITQYHANRFRQLFFLLERIYVKNSLVRFWLWDLVEIEQVGFFSKKYNYIVIVAKKNCVDYCFLLKFFVKKRTTVYFPSEISFLNIAFLFSQFQKTACSHFQPTSRKEEVSNSPEYFLCMFLSICQNVSLHKNNV